MTPSVIRLGFILVAIVSIGALSSTAPAAPSTVARPAVTLELPTEYLAPADPLPGVDKTVARPPGKLTTKNFSRSNSSSGVRQIARISSQSMERAAKLLEEYGSATVSAPLLSRPDSVFKFDYTHGAGKYFNDAKSSTQGSAASMTEVSQMFSFGVQAQVDATVMAEYLHKLAQFNADESRIQQRHGLLDRAAGLEYSAAVTAASKITDPVERAAAMAAAQRAFAEKLSPASAATPVFPTFSSARHALPALPANLAKQPTAGSTTGFQGLVSALGGAAPTISNRPALVTAAGDQAVEGIFKVLGNPGEAQKFKDRTALFGVMMVSVDPGWRTQKDFAADVAIRTRYSYQPARSDVIIRMLSDEAIVPNLRRKIAADTGLVGKIPKALVGNDYAAEIVAVETEIAARKEKATQHTEAQKQKEKTESAKKIAAIDRKMLASGPKLGAVLLKMREQELGRIRATLAELQAAHEKNIGALDAEGAQRKVKIDTAKAAFERGITESVNNIPHWLLYGEDEDMNRSPVVTAISPMTETEVLDLADSQREKDAFALSLSFALRYAGLGAQAEAFEEFARTRQKDVKTRSGIAAVNTYSNSGGVFGFQIGPRLRAIADPASTKGMPGNILERQSFPALVAFGFDNDDLRPRLVAKNGKVLVMEPMLSLTQVTRWLPLKHEFFSWRDWFSPKNWHNPRVSEVELVDIWKEEEGQIQEVAAFAADRQEILAFATKGSTLDLSLPADMVVPLEKALLPQPSNIVPSEVVVVKKGDGSVPPRQQTVAIFGKGLGAVNLQEIKVLSGSASVNKDAGKAPVLLGNAIQVVLDVKGAESPIVLQLPFDPVKAGIDADQSQMWISTQPIPVALITEKSPPAQPSQAAAAPKASRREVAYQKSVDATGKTVQYTIAYDPTAPAPSVIAAAKSLLEPEKEQKPECTTDVPKLKSLCFSNTP